MNRHEVKVLHDLYNELDRLTADLKSELDHAGRVLEIADTVPGIRVILEENDRGNATVSYSLPVEKVRESVIELIQHSHKKKVKPLKEKIKDIEDRIRARNGEV